MTKQTTLVVIGALRVKGKGTLNAMYVLKYPALTNKLFGANLIKIG